MSLATVSRFSLLNAMPVGTFSSVARCSVACGEAGGGNGAISAQEAKAGASEGGCEAGGQEAERERGFEMVQ